MSSPSRLDPRASPCKFGTSAVYVTPGRLVIPAKTSAASAICVPRGLTNAETSILCGRHVTDNRPTQSCPPSARTPLRSASRHAGPSLDDRSPQAEENAPNELPSTTIGLNPHQDSAIRRACDTSQPCRSARNHRFSSFARARAGHDAAIMMYFVRRARRAFSYLPFSGIISRRWHGG